MIRNLLAAFGVLLATSTVPLASAQDASETGNTGETEQKAAQDAAPTKLPGGQALLDVVNSLAPAIVRVVATDGMGVDVAAGSGFVVGDGLIAASHRIVAQGPSGRVVLGNGVNVPIEHVVGADRERDLVLVSLGRPEHFDVTTIEPIKVADRRVQPEDEILVITREESRPRPAVAKGDVAAVEELGERGRLLRLDVKLFGAPAGGLVLGKGGEAYGMALAAGAMEDERVYAAPAKAIRSLLDRAESAERTTLKDYHTAYGRDIAAASDAAGEPEEPVDLEATIVKRDDGSMLIDDRYVVRGAGTKDDPYRITWDLLVSAGQAYRPREGRTELPERVTLLDDKWVQLEGYIAFPLMAESSDEILFMLNQWDGCCIGVPPTPYDAVEVTLVAPVRMQGGVNIFNYGAIRGKLKVDPYIVNDWLVGLYLMEEAQLELEM